MAKYDIGIMGFWYGCNYGSILTYFALNSCLKDMGKSVLMIDKPVIIKGDAEYRRRKNAGNGSVKNCAHSRSLCYRRTDYQNCRP